MKAQYFGDVNDYRKYALLRLIAKEGGFKVGVNWLLTEDDGGPDGEKRSYLRRPERWRRFDEELFDYLSRDASAAPSPFEPLKSANIISDAVFHMPTTPDALAARDEHHRQCLQAFSGVDLVFVDPDNGLEIASCPKGRKGSNKFVYLDELAEHYREGRSLLIYQHYPRIERTSFIQRLSQRLANVLPDHRLWAFETAHVVFLLAAQPNHASRVTAVVDASRRRLVPDCFRRIHAVEKATT